MREHIARRLRKVNAARFHLGKAITAEIGSIAEHHHVDEMHFGLADVAIRDGKVVAIEAIDKLVCLYAKHVTANGIWGQWTRGVGWQREDRK